MLQTLELAEAKHPNWPTAELKTNQKDNREKFVVAAAIVAEEAGELVRTALQFAHENGQYYHMHMEAAQTAAMGIRFMTNAHDISFKY